jgi:hypothetical protein
MHMFGRLCIASTALAAGWAPLHAQDLAARIKAGEGYGTSAVTSGEIADCWATWSALREHISAKGRGGFPEDYSLANLDIRIAEWSRAMDAAFEDYPDERVPRGNQALAAARAEIGGSGLGARAEASGHCKTLPGGVRSKVPVGPVRMAIAVPPAISAPPAPAPAPGAGATADWRTVRDTPGEAADWRRKGRAFASGEGVAKDPQQALFWTRKAAEAGLPSAQFDMASFHINSFGGLTADPAQIFTWMRKAAESGIPRAQDNVGLMYLQGDGVSKSAAEAARWFRRAAEQGHPDGQVDLGLRYWAGDGVAQNQAEAAAWFRKAAEQGDADGQFWLGNA